MVLLKNLNIENSKLIPLITKLFKLASLLFLLSVTLLLLLLPELLLGVVTVLGVVGVGSGLGTYFSLTVILKLVPDIPFSLKDASENLIPPTLIVPLPTLLPVTVNETIPKEPLILLSVYN